MFQQGHQPDTQGNSKDALEGPDLASGSTTTGMSGGALGDASDSDVVRGYSVVDNELANRPPVLPPDAGANPLDGDGKSGFLSRPGGWER